MAASETCAAALHYADAYGIPVFPLWPGRKEPMTPHGFKDSSTDPSTISRWWQRTPAANVGGEMGHGIVCLDFDRDDGAGYDSRDWLAAWEIEHGRLPETACAVTGRGGAHYFYRVDRPVPKSENEDLHIDIRGDGSYVMLAPSVHPNGNTVYWDLDPDEYGIAEADENVYALIEAVRPAPTKVDGEFGREDAGVKITATGRNNHLFKLASSMQAQSFADEAILAAIRATNVELCDPPLDDREVVKVVRSVCERYPKGLSDEAVEMQKTALGGAETAAAGTQAAAGASSATGAKTGRRGRPDAAQVADTLMDEFGACVVDGIPAVVIDGRWAMGSAAVDRAAWMVDRRAGLGVLREVQHRILTLAPRKAQSDPRYVGFANCVVDIETAAELEWTDELVIPNIIPVEWDPAAVCPEVDAFLDRLACGRADVVLNLHQVLGYSMYRSNEFGQAPVLVNPQGANGKSSFIKVVRALVGPENATAIDVNDLGRRFQAEAAAGKLVILSDDTGAGFIEANSMAVVKKVITGDEIHTDVKNGKGYDFIPRATLVISANRLPRMQDNSGGTMRRWFPIPFDAHFAKGEPGFDPRAVAKVTTPEALRRVAVLAMSGLAVMRAEDGFTPNHASEQMIQEIELDNSTVAQFMDEEGIDAVWLDGRPTEEVYLRYEKWAEDAGVQHPLGRRSVTRELSERGNVRNVATRRKTATGEFVGVRVFKAGNVPNDAKKTG